MTKVFTVTELTSAIKQQLESRFRTICVQGEVSNFKAQSSGHLYFSMKDNGAQISAVMFRGSASNLSTLPKAGDQIIIQGEISVYPPRGNYQIIVRELHYVGVGQLLMKLHQLKETLKNRGWFSPEIKKTLPRFPKKIGVITSPTGAVIQDVLHVLSRRFSGFHLLLNPVKVQGEGAAEEIAEAIRVCNRYRLADILIVGRGGGSLEDLWAFNEEIVATAIHESTIPIISAVGHETDFTIADLCADVRAPTPSAAAEIVMAEKEQLLSKLEDAKQRVIQHLKQHAGRYRQLLQAILTQPVINNSYALLGMRMQRLDEMRSATYRQIIYSLQEKRNQWKATSQRMQALRPSQQILQKREQFSSYQKRCEDRIYAQLQLHRERLQKLCQHLRSLDPKNLMKKGYSILFSEKDHSIILSSKQVQPKDKIQAMTSDGQFTMTVDE